MQVLHVVGARPNFMKAAPVLRALSCHKNLQQTLVHTGQHYDVNMSDVFFAELDMPEPDVNLGVGSHSLTRQTAEIMVRLESALLDRKPNLVLVYGDVNSTVAAALVCAKLLIPVGHVEAGLRSFDRTMPEEINRLLTDQVSDLLFTPSADGDENLRREGVSPEKIHCVGNVMIDTLVALLPTALERSETQHVFDLERYGLVTLHRPSNVDDSDMLISLVDTLKAISSDIPLIFPIHPRTQNRLEQMGFSDHQSELYLSPPLSYLDFLALQYNSKLVITDSGGIQEETTYLGIPCLTVRENTERPVTVTLGTNTLVGQNMERLQAEVRKILAGETKQGEVPPQWDGHAAERIANTIVAWHQPYGKDFGQG